MTAYSNKQQGYKNKLSEINSFSNSYTSQHRTTKETSFLHTQKCHNNKIKHNIKKEKITHTVIKIITNYLIFT